MKIKCFPLKKKFSAFSLVEVVAAVGVVAIGIIAILGLLPSGLNSSRDTANETRAALMAQSIYSTLRSQPFDKVELFGEDVNLSSQNGPLQLYSDINGNITNVESAESVFFLNLDFNNSPTNFPTSNPSRVNQVALTVTWLPTNNVSALKFVSFVGDLK
ncbi:MAG: Verru_Chthon cassette protein B [Verrucomicrobiae bacterium]|nr:Verru_Chthon cassette protein B [Verrucomicrobiae bacterium]